MEGLGAFVEDVPAVPPVPPAPPGRADNLAALGGLEGPVPDAYGGLDDFVDFGEPFDAPGAKTGGAGADAAPCDVYGLEAVAGGGESSDASDCGGWMYGGDEGRGDWGAARYGGAEGEAWAFGVEALAWGGGPDDGAWSDDDGAWSDDDGAWSDDGGAWAGAEGGAWPGAEGGAWSDDESGGSGGGDGGPARVGGGGADWEARWEGLVESAAAMGDDD